MPYMMNAEYPWLPNQRLRLQSDRMSAAPLRQRAEKLFGKSSARSKGRLQAMSPQTLRETLHELGVHQIELEMQNEELLRTQADLEAARARYLDLYDSAPVGYCSISETELVLEANRAASTLLGVSKDELLNRPLSRAIIKEDVDTFYLLRKKVVRTGEKQECELRMRRQGGVEFWANLTCSIAQNDSRPMLHVVISDITARKQIEEKALQLQETLAREKERLEALVNSVSDEIWFADKQSQFTLVNPSGRSEFRLQGSAPVDIRSLAGSLEVFRPDGSPRPVEEAPPLRALRGETLLKQDEIVRTPATGDMRYRQVSSSPVKDAAGNVVGSVSVVRDVTEQTLIEQKIRKLNLELESRVAERTSALQGLVAELKAEISERRRLEREILKISDYEQSRIGRDLHDGACQELAGLAVLAEVVARDLDRENSQAAAKVLEISNLARQSLDEIRRLAAGLLSVKVEQHGLEWALRDLADETSTRNNVRCVFTVRQPIAFADSNVAVQVFRIVQEAISNSLRHGRAQNITIELAESNGTVSLIITDDGVGLPRRRKKDGLGLHSMQYRAKRLGGAMEVRRAVKSGTVVICSFPSKEFLHGKEKNKN